MELRPGASRFIDDEKRVDRMCVHEDFFKRSFEDEKSKIEMDNRGTECAIVTQKFGRACKPWVLVASSQK